MQLTESERRLIAVRFFQFCADTLPTERIAALLSVSEKQVVRLQRGRSTPQQETARRMADLMDEARNYAVLSEGERNEMAERRRAEAEARLRATRIVRIRGLEEKDIQRWFADARNLIEQQAWREAIGHLRVRIEDPDDWKNVPARTKAYVLSDMAVCLHKNGEFAEAADFAQRAMENRSARHPANPTNQEVDDYARFMTVTLSNLGASKMQMGYFDEALALFDRSARYIDTYFPPFYNAVCCASKAHDDVLLAARLGELKGAAARFTAQDIEEMLNDFEADKDLVYAREHAMFAELVRHLQGIASDKRNGRKKPSANDGDLRA